MFEQTQLFYELKTVDNVLRQPTEYSHTCDGTIHQFAMQSGINHILNHMAHINGVYKEAIGNYSKENPDASYLCHIFDMYIASMQNAMRIHCTKGYWAMIEECLATVIPHLHEVGYELLEKMGFNLGTTALAYMAPNGGLVHDCSPLTSTLLTSETVGAYNAADKEMFTELFDNLDIDGTWIVGRDLIHVFDLSASMCATINGSVADGYRYVTREMWEKWRSEAGKMYKLMDFARQARGYKELPRCQSPMRPTTFEVAAMCE